MKHYVAAIISVLVIGTPSVIGQTDRFSLGGIFGVNFSNLQYYEQHLINGEQRKHNNGLNTGIFCNAILNKHFNFKVEMLYSVNGNYVKPNTFPNTYYGKVKIRYLEVPFHLDFLLNSFKRTKKIPDWTIELGGAYAKLFSYFAEDANGNDVSGQIDYGNKDALLVQLGTTVFFSNHFGANWRWSVPVFPVFHDRSSITGAIRLIYRL